VIFDDFEDHCAFVLEKVLRGFIDVVVSARIWTAHNLLKRKHWF
jgi:hypothetical protein